MEVRSKVLKNIQMSLTALDLKNTYQIVTACLIKKNLT